MVKKIVTISGFVFVAIGVMGFFYNPLIGIFLMGKIYNIVHILSGVAALYMAAQGEATAKLFSKSIGTLYGVIALLGIGLKGEIFGLMIVNYADNILNLLIALFFLYIGFVKSGAGNQRIA